MAPGSNDQTLTDPSAPERPLVDVTRLSEGDQIGRYLIEEVLGAGGMGMVYLAHDPQLERDVALKVLRQLDDGPRALAYEQRLLREGRTLAQLSHPNVVTVHDVGTAHGRVFVAMELVRGQTLKDWLRAEARDRAAVLDVFAAAGRGLAAAHARGVVHRDFKPSNVMVGDDGRVVVTDFGLARPAASPDGEGPPLPAPTSPEITRTGVVVGTPAYMAPEQHRGQPADPRTDQFSFCVALYEALCGDRPFSGATTDELTAAIAAGAFATDAGQQLPAWLWRILRRGLAANPDDRYPDLDALLRDLADDPVVKRRRRIRAGIVTAVALVGGFALAAVLLRPAAAKACQIDDPFETLWSAEAQARLRASIDASGIGFADDAWRRIAGEVERYSREAQTMRRESCEATRVRGEQSAELMDRRRACLDQQTRELAAVLDILASGDAAAIETLTAAERIAPDVARCAATTRLMEQPPVPPGKEAEVRALEAVLAELAADLAARRAEEVIASARRLLPRAQAVGFAPNLAEIYSLLCGAQSKLEDADEAIDACLHAARFADAAWDDGLRLENLLRAARAMSMGNRHDDARQILQLAEGALAKSRHPAGRVKFLRAQSLRAWWEGDYEEALEPIQQALTLADAEPDVPVMVRVNVLHVLAMVESDRVNAEAALSAATRALHEAEAELGSKHPDIHGYTQTLGLVLRQLNQLEESESYLRRTLDLVDAAPSVSVPARARANINLATTLSKRGLHEDALAHIQQAITHFEAAYGPDDPRLGGPFINKGSTLARLERWDEAEHALQRGIALDIANYGEESPVVAQSLRELAELHADRGKFREALATQERAFAIVERAAPDSPAMLYALVGLGRAARDVGDRPRARRLLQRSLAFFDKYPQSGGYRESVELDIADLTVNSDPAGARRLAEAALARARAEAAAKPSASPALGQTVADIERWLAEHS